MGQSVLLDDDMMELYFLFQQKKKPPNNHLDDYVGIENKPEIFYSKDYFNRRLSLRQTEL